MEGSVAMILGWAVPAGHMVHDELPAADHVPAMQGTQVKYGGDTAGMALNPARHVHWEIPDPAGLDEFAGHRLHTWAPGVENMLAPHSVQAVEFADAKVPEGQIWHVSLELAPSSLENFPASQERHDIRTLTPYPKGL